MITPAMDPYSSISDSWLKDFLEMKDLTSLDLRLLKELDDKGFNLDNIKQTCLVTIEPSIKDEIIIRRYVGPRYLLTSLICDTIDKDSEYNLNEYIHSLSEIIDIDDTTLKRIELFGLELSQCNHSNLDTVIIDNYKIINIIYKLLDQSIRGKMIEEENEESETIDKSCSLFWSQIIIKSRTVWKGHSKVLGSKINNGMYKIKKSQNSEYLLNIEDIEKYRKIIDNNKNTRFCDQDFFMRYKNNNNSILYSIYLVEMISNKLEGVLNFV